MKESCGNCRFYKDKGTSGVKEGYGACQRYPKYSETNDGRWCGEYTPDELSN